MIRCQRIFSNCIHLNDVTGTSDNLSFSEFYRPMLDDLLNLNWSFCFVKFFKLLLWTVQNIRTLRPAASYCLSTYTLAFSSLRKKIFETRQAALKRLVAKSDSRRWRNRSNSCSVLECVSGHCKTCSCPSTSVRAEASLKWFEFACQLSGPGCPCCMWIFLHAIEEQASQACPAVVCTRQFSVCLYAC